MESTDFQLQANMICTIDIVLIFSSGNKGGLYTFLSGASEQLASSVQESDIKLVLLLPLHLDNEFITFTNINHDMI